VHGIEQISAVHGIGSVSGHEAADAVIQLVDLRGEVHQQGVLRAGAGQRHLRTAAQPLDERTRSFADEAQARAAVVDQQGNVQRRRGRLHPDDLTIHAVFTDADIRRGEIGDRVPLLVKRREICVPCPLGYRDGVLGDSCTGGDPDRGKQERGKYAWHSGGPQGKINH
jgi:hypothetical protein